MCNPWISYLLSPILSVNCIHVLASKPLKNSQATSHWWCVYQCKKYRYANLISWTFLLGCLALTDSCDSSEAKRISVTVPSNWPNVCEQFFNEKVDSNVNKSLSAGFRMDFNTKRAFIHIRCYVQTRSWDLSAFFFILISLFILYSQRRIEESKNCTISVKISTFSSEKCRL